MSNVRVLLGTLLITLCGDYKVHDTQALLVEHEPLTAQRSHRGSAIYACKTRTCMTIPRWRRYMRTHMHENPTMKPSRTLAHGVARNTNTTSQVCIGYPTAGLIDLIPRGLSLFGAAASSASQT
jgi:hypothetical protein